MRIFVFIFLICGLSAPALADLANTDRKAAIILSYQRIDDPLEPMESLSRDQFNAHTEMLAGKNILPLPQILEFFAAHKVLPRGAVAVTFDLPAPHIYQEILPDLLARKIPITVFVNPANHKRHIKRLGKNDLVTLGLSVNLNVADKQQALHRAIAEFRKITGHQPTLFAHYAGLYDEEIIALLHKNGFIATFGQQSGVAYDGANMMALPRFTMTGNTGGEERFSMVINARPLPANDMHPGASLVQKDLPAVGMTLPKSVQNIDCFVSGQDKPALHFPAPQRLEIRLAAPIEGRTRINCIAPAVEDPQSGEMRWRWAGFLLQRAD